MSSEPSEPADKPAAYSVRVSAQAAQDVAEAALRLADMTGDPRAARAWKNRLYEAISGLAENPRRFAQDAQASNHFGRETRRLLFRQTPGSRAAYHVFFTVQDQTPDGPRVQVLHVRHAARKPLTRDEARQLLANQ